MNILAQPHGGGANAKTADPRSATPTVPRAIRLGLWLLPWLIPAIAFAQETRQTSFIAVTPDNPYFPFLVLFGLIMAVITFFRPKIGLVVMLFFIMVSTDMPTKGEAIGSRAVTVRIEDLVLVLVSCGWLLNRAKTRSLAMFKASPINQAIIPMALMIVISTIIGYLQGTTRGHAGLLFSIKRLEYFWIFFMTFNLIESEREAKIALNIFLAAAAVVSTIAIFQFAVFPMSDLARGGATATSGFGRANTFASFLLTMIGLAFGMLVYPPERRRQWLLVGAFLIFFLALFMTKSRGAYVSIPPLLLAVWAVSRHRRAVRIIAMLVIFPAIYLSIKLFMLGEVGWLVSRHYDDIGYQFESIGNVAKDGIEADSSLSARYDAWVHYHPHIMQRPAFGHGVGAVPLAMFDNQYVREMYETGFLGLLAFIFMNLTIMATCWHFFRHTANPLYRGLSVGFLGGHVGILVHALTIENFYTIFNMEAFWFLLALLMVFYHHEAQREWRQPERQDNTNAPPATGTASP